jgi:tetraacyldisaccharide 4'-kinase
MGNMQNSIKCNSKKISINFSNIFIKLWYQPNCFVYFLLPLSWCYQGIIFLRHFFYRIGLKTITHFKVPVIVVGNLTVGGTGKTPLVIWLANLLQKEGFRPGIVSRGYKAKTTSFPHIVNKKDTASLVGDEAILIAQKTNCPIVIDPNRVAAVKKLLAATNCNIVISDDGLQHLALGRDLEILVIDGKRRLGNGFCLPGGPLREPKNKLNKVDFIVTNGQALNGEFSMQFKVQKIYNLKNPRLHRSAINFKKETIHAVTGIGNPEKFFSLLRKLKLKIIEHPFPDHYHFSSNDFDFGDNLPIIMTEKDAVKCKSFVKKNFWGLAIYAQMPTKFSHNLLKKISA